MAITASEKETVYTQDNLLIDELEYKRDLK